MRRLTSLFILIAMLIGMMPSSAFAEDGAYRAEANKDYVFAINGEKETYTLLGGDAQTGYFVLANDYYGTYPYSTSGSGYSFDDTTCIAYWLNNGFLASSNTLSENIVRYIDKEHQWDEGIGGISLLSKTEVDANANKIGLKASFNKTPVANEENWWLRDNAGNVKRAYAAVGGDSLYVKTLTTSTWQLVRPAFYLKADFFENVKLNTFYTGKKVKESILDLDIGKAGYTGDEITSLKDVNNNSTLEFSANIMPDGEYILNEPYYEISINADVTIKDGYKVIITADGMSPIVKNINFNDSSCVDLRIYLPNEDEKKTYTASLCYGNEVLKSYSEEVLAMTNVDNDTYINKGFVTHIANPNQDVEETVEMLDNIGATVVRDHGLWSSSETTKGEYKWSQKYVDYFNALKEKGIDIMYILVDNNPLYGNAWNDVIDTPEEIEGFANYAVATAKEFPHIKMYEILNEKDSQYTVEQYVALCNATARALKEYDPSIKVIVGALSDATGWMDFASQMVTTDTYPHIDAISFHQYIVWYTGDSKRFVETATHMKNCVREFGGWLDVMLTETGYTTSTAESLNGLGVTREVQAVEMVKRSVTNDMLDFALVTNYVLKDKENSDYGFSFVEEGANPTPAYYAVKTYNEKTSMALFMGEVKIKDGVRAYWYRDNGFNRVVMWQKPDYDNQSPKRENSRTVDVTLSKDINLFDIYGEKIENSGKITLTGTPVYAEGFTDSQMIEAYEKTALSRINDEVKALDDANVDAFAQRYAQICANPDAEAVAELLADIYSYGDTLLEENNGETRVLSGKLYDLYIIGKEVSKLATLSDDVVFGAEIADTETLYTSFEKTVKDISADAVIYENEPYKKGKELFEEIKGYKNRETIGDKATAHSRLTADGVIKIFGTTQPNKNVTIKLENSGEVEFASFVTADGSGAYEAEFKAKEYGDYVLSINDGTLYNENISYKSAEYSEEEKMMAVKNLQAKRLLEWAQELMKADGRTSEYLYLKDVDFNILDEEKVQVRFTYEDVGSYENNPVVLVSSYDGNTLLDCKLMNTTSGENTFDEELVISGENVDIKVMLWSRVASAEPLKRIFTLTK